MLEDQTGPLVGSEGDVFFGGLAIMLRINPLDVYLYGLAHVVTLGLPICFCCFGNEGSEVIGDTESNRLHEPNPTLGELPNTNVPTSNTRIRFLGSSHILNGYAPKRYSCAKLAFPQVRLRIFTLGFGVIHRV